MAGSAQKWQEGIRIALTHVIGAENWAMLAALVATGKMSDVNPIDDLATPCAPSSTATRKAASKTSCHGASTNHQVLQYRGHLEKLP